MSQRVWIAQCLCPGRHAILATAGEATSRSEAEKKILAPLRKTIQEALSAGAINPCCALCNSKADTWTYEAGRTRFRTMEEAAPALADHAIGNAIANAVFGESMSKTRH